MGHLPGAARAAAEAVARHFSAAWVEARGASPDGYLTIAGRRVAVDVVTIRRKKAERPGVAGPRLRFDRVVRSVAGELRARLLDVVPDGQTAIATITAPILQPAKTVAGLTERIRACLARRAARVEVRDIVHGNRVGVRIVKGLSGRAAKLIAFVHNPGPGAADVIFHLTESLLRALDSAAGRAPEKRTGERWLVIADTDGLSHIDLYRHVHDQLGVAPAFDTIVMVLAGGRVETLTGGAAGRNL